MKKEIVVPYFKNLFSILTSEKGSKIFDKKSVLVSARETGIEKNEIKEIYTGWNTGAREMETPAAKSDAKSLVYWLCAGLLYDDEIPEQSFLRLAQFAELAGVPGKTVSEIIRGKDRFISETSLKKRYTLIVRAAESGSLRNPVKKTGDDARSFYIANQVSIEGIDELQRLLLANSLGIHAALDGPPGVGKTRSVIETAKILGCDLFTKTCSGRTTESHIISHPVLTMQEGVSVTSHINGPLALAMESSGIFYGDEFNLLKEDVQKRLNSAFDERRSIDRNDGVQIKAGPGFWGVISYNPARNMISRDLEDSVADRFIHIHYNRWHSDFKAYVSLKSAFNEDPGKSTDNDKYNISLGWRGITGGNSFFRGEMTDGSLKWYDFFSGQQSSSEPEYVYRVHDRGSIMNNSKYSNVNEMKNLESQAYDPVNFSRVMSRFTDMLHSLVSTGQSPMLAKIGMENILKEEDLELLSLHESSARIEIAALRHYEKLTGMGFNRFLAQSYATRLVIDQVCYGQYREKKLRNTTVYEIVSRIAQSLKLMFGSNTFNTNFKADTILPK